MVILAVDDDAEDFEFFCDAIKEIDPSISILQATNGYEALELLRNHVLMPDFIFLDINMPLMDGGTCLRQIKEDPDLKKIPVIMYSTTNNQTEIARYKALGANFLVKPGRFSVLVKSLMFILGYSPERSEFFFVFML